MGKGNRYSQLSLLASIRHSTISKFFSFIALAVILWTFLPRLGYSAIIPSGPLTGPIIEDSILTAGGTYTVDADVVVDPGVTLTIEAGAQLIFNGYTGLIVDGTLLVQGTAANPVTFTTGDTYPSKSDWKGIKFTATSVNSVIDYAHIQWAGRAIEFDNSSGEVHHSVIENNATGIRVYQNSNPLISDGNVIRDNSWGVYLYGQWSATNDPRPTINNNSIYDNSQFNLYGYGFANASTTFIDAENNWWGTTDISQIELKLYNYHDNANVALIDYLPMLDSEGGNPTNSTALAGDWDGSALIPNASYDIIWDFTVPLGQTLTVPSGVTFRVHGRRTDILVDGQLLVQGTVSAPVRFTTGDLYPSKGDWPGITFSENTSGHSIDYARIEWANQSLKLLAGSDITIRNSTIDNSYYGLYFSNAHGDVQSTTIQNQSYGVYIYRTSNVSLTNANTITANNYGVYVYGSRIAGQDPMPTVTNNNIYDNNNYNYYAYYFANAASTILNATNNWWGTTDPTAIAAKIYDNTENANMAPIVDFDPMLSAAATPGNQPANVPPNANAGIDQSANEGDTVNLDGSGSSDSDGTIVAYSWIQTAGPSVSITNANTATPSFTAPDVTANTVLTFQLTVTDNANAVGVDTVNITVADVPPPNVLPSANAGADQSVTEGDIVNLNGGQSSDSDGTIVAFSWVQTSGPNVTLNNANTATPNFTAPQVTADTVLTFQLTVTDDDGDVGTDAVNVTVNDIPPPNVPPTANAGNDQSVTEGDMVNLDGSASSDIDGTIVAYNWAQIEGSTVTLNAADTAMPDFVAPLVTADETLTFELTVTDDANDISVDTVVVTVLNIPSGGGTGTTIPPGALTGPITEDSVLAAGGTYTVDADVVVDPGVTLTIEAGTQLIFNGYTTGLVVDGTLLVQGTADNPVVFTTGDAFPSKGDWKGIKFTATSVNSVVEYADIQWAYRGIEFDHSSGEVHYSVIENNTTGVYIYQNGNPLISDGNIIRNNTYGIYLSGQWSATEDPRPSINNNSIYDNTSYNLYSYGFANASTVVIDMQNNWWGTTDVSQIELKLYNYNDNANAPTIDYVPMLDSEGGNPTNSTALLGDWDNSALTPGATYDIISDFTVPLGQTLIVPAGVTFRVHGRNTDFFVDGQLLVQGTLAAPVQFTSGYIYPSKASWRGVTFSENTSGHSIDHVHIEWANQSLKMLPGSDITIKNSTIDNSYYGIYFSNAHGDVQNTTVQNQSYGVYIYQTSNVSLTNANNITGNNYGVYVYGRANEIYDPSPVVSNNNIYDNNNYNYYAYRFGNAANTVLDATNNWWGTTDPSAIAAKIFDNTDSATWSPVVDFDPMLTAAATPGSQPANVPPTANAGVDQSVNEGDTVNLDGSGSSDSDGTIVAYSWTQTAGPSVTITNANTATPNFMAPQVTSDTVLTFQLTVTDNASDVGVDTVNITVADVPPPNVPPSANAGSDQSVTEGDIVNLNGGQSSDSDGTIVAYSWVQTAGPNVTLSNANTATPNFTAPQVTADTVLTFQLTVTDDDNDVGTDTVNVTVSDTPTPGAPSLNAIPAATFESVVAISGSGTPGMRIRLYVNSSIQATTFISANGTFQMTALLTQGSNSIYATEQLPEGGAESSPSNSLSITYGLSAPVLDALPTQTSESQIDISGSTHPGLLVNISNNGSAVANGSANGQGQFTIPIELTAGSNAISATVSNGQLVSASSGSQIVNYTAPTSVPLEVPVVDAPEAVVNSFILDVSGSSTPNETVNIYVNDVYQKSTSSNVFGRYATSVVLAEGNNSIKATIGSPGSESAFSGIIQVIMDNVLGITLVDETNVSTTSFQANNIYEITENIIVRDGDTMTIEAGAELRFARNIAITVINGSTLNVDGTPANPVIFTSLNIEDPVPSDWGGLIFIGSPGNNGLSRANINNAIIQYAGNGITFHVNTLGDIRGSTIRNNRVGIKVQGDGSGSQNEPWPSITNNNIYANAEYNLVAQDFNYDPFTRATYGGSINAFHNWWGSADLTEVLAGILDGGDCDTADRCFILDPANENYHTRPLVNVGPYLTSENGSPQPGVSGVMSTNARYLSDFTFVAGATYLITGDVMVGFSTLNAPQTLTIPAGTRLEFANNARLIMGDYGELDVNGTSANPVVFTSAYGNSAQIGDWGGLIAKGNTATGGVANIAMDNAIVEYARNGLYFNVNSRGNVINSDIQNNSVGVVVQGDGSGPNFEPYPQINGNNIHHNSQYNFVTLDYGYDPVTMTPNNYHNAIGNWWGTTDIGEIFKSILDGGDCPGVSRCFLNESGQLLTRNMVSVGSYLLEENGAYQSNILNIPNSNITTDLTLVAGATYRITADIRIGFTPVNAPQQVTIPAGTRLEFENGARLVVGEYGSVTTMGTASEPVVFTSASSEPKPGDWGGIYVRGSQVSNVSIGQLSLSNTVVEYADIGVHFDVNSSGSIVHSKVRYNNIGIQAQGDGGGIENEPWPTVQFSSLYDNIEYNYVTFGYPYDASNQLVSSSHTANYNWWGTTDVAEILSTILDGGDCPEAELCFDGQTGTRPLVDIGPYTTSDGGTAPQGLLGLPRQITSLIALNWNSTYLVTGDVRVGIEGITTQTGRLSIPQGTRLEFANGARLIVIDNGALEVNSITTNPVLFTSAHTSSPQPGDWGGIYLKGGDGLSQWAHIYLTAGATVEYADVGVHFDINSMGNVTHSTLRSNIVGVKVQGDGDGPGAEPEPYVASSALYDNTAYNYVIQDFPFNANYQSAGSIRAPANWWGTINLREILDSILDGGDCPDAGRCFDAQNGTRPSLNIGSYLASEGGSVFPPYLQTLQSNITFDLTLTAGATYLVTGDVIVGEDSSNVVRTLTIPANTRLEFANGARLIVSRYGRVYFAGDTVNGPVTLTSAYTQTQSPQSGDWGGVYFSGANTINGTAQLPFGGHTVIEYANIGLHFGPNSTGTLRDSVVRFNNIGIKTQGDGSGPEQEPLPVVTQTSFYENTEYNYVTEDYPYNGNIRAPLRALWAKDNWWGTADPAMIDASILDGGDCASTMRPSRCFTSEVGRNYTRPMVDFDSYLLTENGSPIPGYQELPHYIDSDTLLSPGVTYLVTHDVIVGQNQTNRITLTILGGTKLLFTNGARLIIDHNGWLDVRGDTDNPVLFSSANPDPQRGDWGGIYVRGAAVTGGAIPAVAHIDNAIIEYAIQGVLFDTHGIGQVTNSLIRENFHGIQGAGNGAATITGNTIINNVWGISLTRTTASFPSMTITSNTIMNNSAYGLYVADFGTATNIVSNVSNNWWGTPTPQIGTDIRYFNSLEAVAPVNSPAPSESLPPAVLNMSVSSPVFSTTGLTSNPNNSTTFTATLSSSASWTVRLLPGNGTNPINRSFNGSGTSVNVFWDGFDERGIRGRGLYYFELTATNTNGTTKPVRIPVIADGTLPSSNIDAIDSPVAGNVVVTGTASDKNMENYVLELGNGGGPLNFQLLGTLTNSNKSVSNSVLGVLDTSSLPDGPYMLRLRATDKAGSIGTDLVQFTVRNIDITNVDVSVNKVNTNDPNIHTMDAALGDTVTVDFSINLPATVSLRWYPEDGNELIAEVTENFTFMGNKTMTWNGRDLDGNIVKNDAYRFEIYATDGVKETLFATFIPGDQKQTYFINGSQGDVITNRISSRNIYTNTHLYAPVTMNSACIPGCRLKAEVLIGDTYLYTAYDQVFEAGQTGVLHWNSRKPDGNWETAANSERLWVYDMIQLNQYSVIANSPNAQLKLYGPGTADPLDISIKSDPYLVYHSYEQFTHIEFYINQDALVTVKLLPPGVTNVNSPQAVVLAQSQSMSANLGDQTGHQLEWRGYNDQANVVGDTNDILVDQNGAYEFVIEATSQVTGETAEYRGFVTLKQ